MKKSMIIVYSVLFALMGWLFLTSWANAINNSVPSVSERFIVWTDYNAIANKIFKKFITKYPKFINQVSCEDIDSYVNKILSKTKIKFRKPDVNKENTVKHIFENLLRDYINNNLECDDFIDVDWDDIEPVLVEEYVKCVFDDWNNKTMQSCYSSNGKRACKWIWSCSMKINWYVWDEITWKSSCGEYAYTKIDWEDKYARFNCNQVFPTCNSSQEWLDCLYPETIKIEKAYDKK